MLRKPPQRATPAFFILGLDPSLTACAGVVIDQKGTAHSRFLISPGKQRGLERLSTIVQGVSASIRSLVSVAGGSKVLVVREDYAYAASSGSDAVLKELGGILLWELHKMGIIMHTVGVAQVKKFVTGKGNAQKDQMMLAVYKSFSYDPRDEHDADAFGVAITARALVLRSSASLTAPQREVVVAATAKGHPLTMSM